ncbi:MAG TPA: tetratricopeptide repeat protein [Thermoanaerobaculia bacterium]|jgi:tetratricopeptide (TPR) repeat protein
MIHLPSPRRSPRRQATPLLLASLAILLPLAACGGGPASNASATTQLSFGVSMARRGLWQEALFRFREAERLDPRNAHVQNNLGVAYEAAGDFDKALEYYKKAIAIAPDSREVKNNYTRFVEFYQGFKAKPGKGEVPKAKSKRGAPEAAPASQPSPPSQPLFPDRPPAPGGLEPNTPRPPEPPPPSP